MTRFYVSARFGRQQEARRVAEEVAEATGWECTARWLDATPDDDALAHHDRARMMGAAILDIDDVRRADVMFALTEDVGDDTSYYDCYGERIPREVPASWARGGRHVEVGYAIASSIPVIVIGPRENVFHGLCHQAGSVDEAIEAALKVATNECPSCFGYGDGGAAGESPDKPCQHCDGAGRIPIKEGL